MDDPDPHKRNLVVTSLAFIIFYFADGQVTDTVQLSIVSVTFGNPAALAIAAWVLLFWFALRYWQAQELSWRREFRKELIRVNTGKSLRRFAEAYTGLQHYVLDGITGMSLSRRELGYVLSYKKITEARTDESGKITGVIALSDHSVEITGLYGTYWLLIFCIRTAWYGTVFTSLVFPYLAFVAAVVCGLLVVFAEPAAATSAPDGIGWSR